VQCSFLSFIYTFSCALNGPISTLPILVNFGLTWLIMTSLRSYDGGMEMRMRVMHAKVMYSSITIEMVQVRNFKVIMRQKGVKK
jgi:hypothetical protein